MPDILTDATGRKFILGSPEPTQTLVTPPTPRYTVTITGGYINEVGTTQLTVDEGTTVTLLSDFPTYPDGWYAAFVRFKVEGGTDITSYPATITVRRDLTITGEYKQIGLLSYDLQEGITLVTPQPHEFDRDAQMTFTATLADGYEFVGWYNGSILLSDTNPGTFALTTPRITLIVTAKAVQQVGWNVENNESVVITTAEDIPVSVFDKNVTAGISSTYHMSLQCGISPQPGDTFDVYFGDESATGNINSPVELSVTGESMLFDISVSRARHWEFSGEITCDDYDEPLYFSIMIN